MDVNFPELTYLDLDGRGVLVPIFAETMKVSKQVAEQYGFPPAEEVSGEVTAYKYRNDLVALALDPSMTSTEEKENTRINYSYGKESQYIFYLPNRNYGDEVKPREHIIKAGDREYLVTLISVRSENAVPEYTFRIEEVL